MTEYKELFEEAVQKLCTLTEDELQEFVAGWIPYTNQRVQADKYLVRLSNNEVRILNYIAGQGWIYTAALKVTHFRKIT